MQNDLNVQLAYREFSCPILESRCGILKKIGNCKFNENENGNCFELIRST